MGATGLDDGYIGLGEMGRAMCSRLVTSGRTVVAFDLDAAALDAAVAGGAQGAADAAEVARRSDVVSICVPADHHVLAVVDALEAGAHEGLTVLIHSTVHPDTMRAAAERVAAWGGRCHDACVAGGDAAAREGQLVMFVSDLDEVAPRAREVLDRYSDLLIDTGPAGSGAAVKIGVNVMTYAQQAALIAAYELVAHQGASVDALVAAWRHNGQFGPVIERFSALAGFPPEALRGMADYLSNVVSIAQKDLDLALALGEGTPRGPSPAVAAIRDHMPTIFGQA